MLADQAEVEQPAQVQSGDVSTPAVLGHRFSRLSEGCRIVGEMQRRPWGATDGQVTDRFGLHWLIGTEDGEHD